MERRNAMSLEISDMPSLLAILSNTSARPRYAFMVLNLIAQAADADGQAGPWMRIGTRSLTIRDWLCESLVPMGQRDPRRAKLVARVREELEAARRLPADAQAAAALIDTEVLERVRHSGSANISRAVSDLVRAGLMDRHYEGYRVDHVNRGAQRHAVYTVPANVRRALHGAGEFKFAA
jgi:hypothetical protein